MLCVTRAGEKMERETEHWWLEPTRVFALTGKRGPRVIDFTLILAVEVSTYKNTLICFWCGFIYIDKENYCTCKCTFDASIQCTLLRIGFASTGKTSLATETKVPTESARCALCRNFFFLFSAADED